MYYVQYDKINIYVLRKVYNIIVNLKIHSSSKISCVDAPFYTHYYTLYYTLPIVFYNFSTQVMPTCSCK